MTPAEAQQYVEDREVDRDTLLALLASDYAASQMIQAGLIVQTKQRQHPDEVIEEITPKGALVMLGLLVRLTANGKEALANDNEQLMHFLDGVVPAFHVAADVFAAQELLAPVLEEWKDQTGQ